MLHVQVEDHHFLLLIRPMTSETLTWLKRHTDGEWLGGAVEIEPACLEGLMDALAADCGTSNTCHAARKEG